MILQVTGLVTCKLEWQDAHPFIDVIIVAARTQALDSGTSRLGMVGSQWELARPAGDSCTQV